MFQMFAIIKYNPATTTSCVFMLKFSIQSMCNISIYIKFTLGIGPRLKKKTTMMFRYNIYKFTTTKFIVIQSVNVPRHNSQFILIMTSVRLYRFSISRVYVTSIDIEVHESLGYVIYQAIEHYQHNNV